MARGQDAGTVAERRRGGSLQPYGRRFYQIYVAFSVSYILILYLFIRANDVNICCVESLDRASRFVFFKFPKGKSES